MNNNRFRELISKTGLSQKAFGELMKIPLRTVESWSSGKRKAPEYEIDLIEFWLKHNGYID